MRRSAILKDWFLIRRDLPASRRLILTCVSFLLPIAVWCFVSYVPWIWHPDVKIELSAEREGVTTVFTAGDHVSRSFFPNSSKQLEKTTPPRLPPARQVIPKAEPSARIKSSFANSPHSPSRTTGYPTPRLRTTPSSTPSGATSPPVLKPPASPL